MQLRNLAALLCIAFSAISTCSSAHADLTLVIDTANKTFALTGSVDLPYGSSAVTYNGANVGGSTRWIARGLTAGHGQAAIFFYNQQTFSTTVGVPALVYAPFSTGRSVTLRSGHDENDVTNGGFDITLNTETSSPQTLTGSGVFQSYGSLGAGPIERLESLIGAQIFNAAGDAHLGGWLTITSISGSRVVRPNEGCCPVRRKCGLGLSHWIHTRRR